MSYLQVKVFLDGVIPLISDLPAFCFLQLGEVSTVEMKIAIFKKGLLSALRSFYIQCGLTSTNNGASRNPYWMQLAA